MHSQRTVLVVQLGDVEAERALLDDLVVGLVPEGGRGKTRARELGQRVEVQTMHDQANAVQHVGGNGDESGGGQHRSVSVGVGMGVSLRFRGHG